MRLISWNCQGKFREKFKYILSLDADVCVIQECENPDLTSNEDYKAFAKNYVWTGEKKGLGIFVKEGMAFKENPWPNGGRGDYLSIRMEAGFDLLAVWTHKPYIEAFYEYLNDNDPNIHENTLILGDFNSNTIWDKKHGRRNHSAVVKALEEKHLVSAYHYITNEPQGEETAPTFFMRRKLESCYHIDYCFLAPERLLSFQVLEKEDWIDHSDHIPIVIDIK